MKIKLGKLFIIFIMLAAFFLRTWQLDANPPGAHPDEADTAYSAFSILKTGLTQYGDFNLLGLTEFNGGTHPPLYTYFLIPLVHLFGLNIVVERMPSAIFGILLIPLFFLLLKKIFQSDKIALVGALFLTLNPWAIHISRQGLLESIAVFFVVLGITLFLYASDKKYLYIFSGIAFGLSLHAYDAPKIFTPVFIIFLAIYQWKSLKKAKKHFLILLSIFAIFYFLMIKVIFLDGQIKDYTNVSLLNSYSISSAVDTERQLTKGPLWLSSIFHNKITVALKRFQTSYFNIFSLNWFFVNGEGHLQQAVVRHGQFHLFELPLFFIGAYVLLKRNKKAAFLILGWLFLGAVPGAITAGNYPYRSVLMLPAPIIFSSAGFVFVWNQLDKINLFLKRSIRLLLSLIIISYALSFIFTYFYDYPVYASGWWFKERNEVLNYANSIQAQYEKVFVVGGLEWAVMYAFNNKTDPRTFQTAYLDKKKKGVINIGKFSFGAFNPNKISKPSLFFPKNSIVIVDGADFPNSKSLKSFYGSDPLHLVYKIVEIK